MIDKNAAKQTAASNSVTFPLFLQPQTTQVRHKNALNSFSRSL